MARDDINVGSRRRLLITAPGAAALVLATRDQGRAKSALSKFRKKQKARAKVNALSRMSMELSGLDDPLVRLEKLGSSLQAVPGLESLGVEAVSIAGVIEDGRDNLVADLAIARGEVLPY